MSDTGSNTILIGGGNGARVSLNLGMANRHGLIAGATGTGKTVTLQVLTEQFSRAGVPVVLADVKGDLSGLAAEECVARDYERRGHITAARRWRGSAREVDLIAADGDGLIFIEVKRSENFERAATYLTDQQAARIYGAASEYLGQMPKGQLTPVRLDLALVNGRGEIRVIENAIMM